MGLCGARNVSLQDTLVLESSLSLKCCEDFPHLQGFLQFRYLYLIYFNLCSTDFPSIRCLFAGSLSPSPHYLYSFTLIVDSLAHINICRRLFFALLSSRRSLQDHVFSVYNVQGLSVNHASGMEHRIPFAVQISTHPPPRSRYSAAPQRNPESILPPSV